MNNDTAKQNLKLIAYQQLVRYTGLKLISGPVQDDQLGVQKVIALKNFL